jgi:hypothetical protein
MAYYNTNLYIAKQCSYTGVLTSCRTTAIDWDKSISNIISMSTLPKGNNLRIIDRIVVSNQFKRRPVIKTGEQKNELIRNNEQKNELIRNNEQKNEQVQDDIQVENFSDVDEDDDDGTENADTVFWDIINRINWYDTDERSLNRQHIKRAFNIDQMRFILSKMENVYMPRLRIAVESAHLEDLVEENFDNVLAHIIMKGKIFYNGIILLPEVSLYLCDKFYPVYDWLHGN